MTDRYRVISSTRGGWCELVDTHRKSEPVTFADRDDADARCAQLNKQHAAAADTDRYKVISSNGGEWHYVLDTHRDEYKTVTFATSRKEADARCARLNEQHTHELGPADMRADREGLLAERESWLKELARLRQQRDDLLAERGRLRRENLELRADVGAARAARDVALADREKLRHERDDLLAERDKWRAEALRR